MKIVFSGGGTGGHIVPIIAVAREIRKLYHGNKLEFEYVGPSNEFTDIFFRNEGIRVSPVLAGKMRRYQNAQSIASNVLDLGIKLPLGVIQAFFKLFFSSPDLVFSKGGYGAIPPTVASWMLGIPVFLHESDISPGLANRIAGRFALRIFTSFARTQHFSTEKVVLVGNPIRSELLTGNKEEATRLFKLVGGKPLILLLGGSQGSSRLNDMFLETAEEMLKRFEVVHQTGESNFEQVKKEAGLVVSSDGMKFYHPVPFVKEPELRHLYAAADFIVNRAGAGSIFEISALKKPSILIPLPEAAQNHQAENAYEYANTGAAIVMEEMNLTPHFFLEKLIYLFDNPKELEKMSRAAASFAKPEAAQVMARTIVEYLVGR